MEFRLNRETVPAAKPLYSGIQEQGVELDYILPDYYPDIFRLVRCEVEPVITEWSASGGRLTYELRCDIRVLYCSDSGSALQCVTQQQTFQKSLELGSPSEEAEITLSAGTDHINYRAVNKRRLDIRAAVSVRVSAAGTAEQEVVSDAFGMNIQLKKTPVRFAAQKLSAVKTMQISEESELSPAQPDVINIISCRCSAPDCELKLISGKLLAKGEADVKLLYSSENNGEGAVESLDLALPYSQIIDLEGVDDSYDCSVSAEVISCDISPAADKNGDNRLLKCELELRLNCRAVKTASVMLAVDAFSTVYPCEVEYSDIQAAQLPTVYSDSFRHSTKLAEGENVPATVYAVWCSPRNINTHIADDGRSAVITGMLTYSMAARDQSGMMTMPDRDEAFEETISLPDDVSGSEVNAEVTVSDVSFNISSDGVLTAKADISVKINVTGSADVRAVTGITIDDSTRKQRDGDYAVKLYFGVENEEIWDIAKRCSTSVEAVMEENELTGDRLSAGGMLLIPIKE